MSIALRTEGLCKQWGSFRASNDISLTLQAGTRHAIIGPNGAGKTTLVNLLTGSFAPSAGEIWLGDTRITQASPAQRVKMGLVRTHQISSLFASLTVLESVLMAILERNGKSMSWFHPLDRYSAEIDEARQLLEVLRLADEADVETRILPYGKQRLLEIALALAVKPRILLLDEPAAGIPAAESAELFDVLARLPREVTILFIEHDMELVFRFAERITVMVAGELLAEGTPAEIAANPLIHSVYLGEGAHG
ncbi:MAG: ABC transporter ATP-binding protein [Janthinobacterium lividum]